MTTEPNESKRFQEIIRISLSPTIIFGCVNVPDYVTRACIGLTIRVSIASCTCRIQKNEFVKALREQQPQGCRSLDAADWLDRYSWISIISFPDSGFVKISDQKLPPAA